MQNSTIITIKPDGIIQSADKNCAKLFGYTIDEMVGQCVDIIIPSPYKEQHHGYLDNYAKTEIPKILGKSRTVEGQHKDGSIFPIRITVSKVGEGEDCIFVGMIDKLEDKSATITIKGDGTVVSCNHNVEELFGYKANEVISHNIMMLMPSPQGQEHDKYLANYITGGEAKTGGRVRNVPAKHKNGNIFPISLQVEDIKVGAIQLFRARMEKVDEIESLIVLDKEGVIIGCNQIFVLPLLGYSSTELIGMNVNILVPPEHQQISYVSSNSQANLAKDKEKEPKNENGEPDNKRAKYHESFADNPDLFWQSTGNCRKQLQHKDGSLFAVDIEIYSFTNSKTGENQYSLKIKRSDSEKTKSQQGGYRMIGPYYVAKTVGQGSYGKVKLAYHKDTRERVAIKILQKSKMKEIDLQRAKRETSILKELKHPYIAQLFDIIDMEDTLNIVMEFAGRTLLSYVLEKNGLGEREALKFFIELVSAMKYCHDRNIIHRDIKHQNILLDDKFNTKLIDFGLSNYMEEGKLRSTFCGTPAYAAPEMIIGKKYNGPEVDIWSMGVVLYSMITGVFPFDNVGDIIKGNFTDPPSASADCCDLLRQMLNVDLAQRITVSGIMEHPWILSWKEGPVEPSLAIPHSNSMTIPPSDGSNLPATAPSAAEEASKEEKIVGKKRSLDEVSSPTQSNGSKSIGDPSKMSQSKSLLELNTAGAQPTSPVIIPHPSSVSNTPPKIPEPVKIIECTVVSTPSSEEINTHTPA